MRNISWQAVLAWLLAAFFIMGGVMNIFATDAILDDYRRWGFPGWFHMLTGVLELAGAAALLFPASRLWGGGLLACVMGGAATTTLRHGEFAHAAAPLVILALLLVLVTFRLKALVRRAR